MSEGCVRVTRADLREPGDREAYLSMLDAYARDPMGGGAPLRDEIRSRVVPALLDHPTTVLWLAWEDDRPVGMLLGFVGFSTFRARRLLNVHDLAVVPERRGRGIGEQLLAAAEVYGRDQGFCKLTLEVQARNARARALYTRVGFGHFAPAAEQNETLFLEKPLT